MRSNLRKRLAVWRQARGGRGGATELHVPPRQGRELHRSRPRPERVERVRRPAGPRSSLAAWPFPSGGYVRTYRTQPPPKTTPTAAADNRRRLAVAHSLVLPLARIRKCVRGSCRNWLGSTGHGCDQDGPPSGARRRSAPGHTPRPPLWNPRRRRWSGRACTWPPSPPPRASTCGEMGGVRSATAAAAVAQGALRCDHGGAAGAAGGDAGGGGSVAAAAAAAVPPLFFCRRGWAPDVHGAVRLLFPGRPQR